MSYAIIAGSTCFTYTSKNRAINAFSSLLVRHADAQLFAVCSSGSFMNLTGRVAVQVQGT